MKKLLIGVVLIAVGCSTMNDDGKAAFFMQEASRSKQKVDSVLTYSRQDQRDNDELKRDEFYIIGCLKQAGDLIAAMKEGPVKKGLSEQYISTERECNVIVEKGIAGEAAMLKISGALPN